MSAVTLETLRADFEAKKRKLDIAAQLGLTVSLFGGRTTTTAFSLETLSEMRRLFAEPESVAGARNMMMFRYVPEWQALLNAANIYLTARDHGFQAATLYKLSDGAIDPRGAA